METQADAESSSQPTSVPAEDCTAHRYTETQTVPTSVLNACLYAAGYKQWLSPNADFEYALEAQRVCQSLYALMCIYYHQTQTGSSHDWENTRQFREYIFEERFYVPELFDECLDFDTPDDMFDRIEADLVAHELVTDLPPDRTSEYVSEAQIQA